MHLLKGKANAQDRSEKLNNGIADTTSELADAINQSCIAISSWAITSNRIQVAYRENAKAANVIDNTINRIMVLLNTIRNTLEAV